MERHTRHSAVWHPNTQMSEWESFDRIVRGDGMWLVDSRGRRMLDGVASMWCNVWGHSNRELASAIGRQVARLQHSPLFNLTHGPAEDLATRLVGISPGMHRVFFSDNGSSAMEIAFKMAIQYWQNVGEKKKVRIASLRNGYHGDTFGSMSVGYVPEFFGRFRGHLFRSMRFPVPDRRHLPAGCTTIEDAEQDCLHRVERALASDGDKTAAFVMESGAQVASGAIVYPHRFQSGIRRICRRHGVLFVLDEIATGFGRLGPMVQYTEQGGSPDVVAYGKMLTGGYVTMAATLATKKVYDSFLGEFGDSAHLFHGHTYTGNPVAAAASVQNLKMYKKHDLLRRISRTSKILARRAQELTEIDSVVDVRHKGMLMGVELAAGATKGFPVGVCKSPSANRVFYEAARRNGVYLRTLGDVVMLVPPLAISGPELEMLVDRTAKTIRDVEKAR